MQRFLVSDTTVVTLQDEQPVIEQGWLGFAEEVEYVGPSKPDEEIWQQAELIDGSELIALPGLINLHTHAGMTPMRGSGDDMPLMPWLKERIWPMEAKLTAEDVYWGTLLGLLEMVRGGTTAINDMYFHNDQVARACLEMGVRANISCALFGIRDDADQWLRTASELIADRRDSSELLTYNFGPHALYTCPPAFLEEVCQQAEKLNVGIQIHLCETEHEVEECKAQHGDKTPVEVLAELGVLDFPTVAAHCVHLTDRDVELLAERTVTAVHNPCSNMKLASGIANIERLRAAGINVALGTDSAVSNNNLSMLHEIRTAALLQKAARMDPTALPASEAVRMATVNGAIGLGLTEEIGQLRQGFSADVTLIKRDSVSNQPAQDPISSLAYSLAASDVDSVFVRGNPLLRKGEFLTVDPLEVTARCREIATKLTG